MPDENSLEMQIAAQVMRNICAMQPEEGMKVDEYANLFGALLSSIAAQMPDKETQNYFMLNVNRITAETLVAHERGEIKTVDVLNSVN